MFMSGVGTAAATVVLTQHPRGSVSLGGVLCPFRARSGRSDQAAVGVPRDSPPAGTSSGSERETDAVRRHAERQRQKVVTASRRAALRQQPIDVTPARVLPNAGQQIARSRSRIADHPFSVMDCTCGRSHLALDIFVPNLSGLGARGRDPPRPRRRRVAAAAAVQGPVLSGPGIAVDRKGTMTDRLAEALLWRKAKLPRRPGHNFRSRRGR